jgi:glycosyltransferase involved in cell wall biosynthesis
MTTSSDKRKRIGIDVTAAVTQGGGIGRYTRELVRALVQSESFGDYEYVFFSARPDQNLPVLDPLPQGENIIYRRAPVSQVWLYRLWHRLRIPVPIQTATGNLDLFHSPDFVLPAVRGPIPKLLTVHDLSFIHYPEAFTPALVRYLNQVVPRSIEQANRILADSQATKKDLIDHWQVPADKITVLYSGVSNSFKPITDKGKLKDIRNRYGLGDKPYLLGVGTLQPRKNYSLLIRAFKEVAQQFPHNLLIAGGKGWLYEEMMTQVDQLGLYDRVRFLGFVADDDLPGLYSQAALFVFPSLYEGFGLPLLEAMACGVPVISSNSSSLPEVVGDAAVTLPPENADAWSDTILALLADSTLRTSLVADGFLQARHFTWKRAAKQLMSIYEELLPV